MKNICFNVLAILTILFTGPSVKAQTTEGKLLTHSIESAALDSTLTYNIYLPPQYFNTEKSYPVFYLLHGYVGDHTDWPEKGFVNEKMDRMLAIDATKPFIIVMPDAHNSWYVDSNPEISWGNYETAIVNDLRKHVENKYRTIDTNNSRYIAGLSMGGYGALHLAFKYPHLFRAAASLSGAFMPEFPEERDDILEGTFGKPFNPKKYQQENPFYLATADSSEQMPVYITCGDDDKGLFHYSIAMYDTLQEKGYRSELRITDGGHSWEVWYREVENVIDFFNNY